jgi:hypothetical protein
MYKSMSEADQSTLEKLRSKTPDWLSRSYPYSPPPDSDTSMKEMGVLISISERRPRYFEKVKEMDSDLVSPFRSLCRELGVGCHEDILRVVMEEASILITKMKWLYNRERPYQFAERHGIDFSPMGSETAHSPSYPSGHTVQALLVGSVLSDFYPQHRKRFMEVADSVSWSRVIGGYHWPSDILFGKDLFRHIISPMMPSSVRLALSESEKEEREDERLVRTSPKSKPPRRDLERGRVKDRDNSDSDADAEQDKKDRSNNYKDADLSARWGRLLLSEEREERRDGDVWKTDEGKWSGKYDGKTQVFESKDSAEKYSKGESKDKDGESPEVQPGGMGPDGESPEVQPGGMGPKDSKVMGDLEGIDSEDDGVRNKAITTFSKTISENMEEFVKDAVVPDEVALEEITQIVDKFTSGPALKQTISGVEFKVLGEKAKDSNYKPSDSEIQAISKGVELALKFSMKDKIESVNKKQKERIQKSRDMEIISDLEGEDAKREESRLLKVTKDSLKKYREMESSDRESSMKSIEESIKSLPEGSRRRMELESEKRGLIVANVLKDGPAAKGVGPSMSVMIQAAEKTGKLDEFLDLTLIGGDDTAESQQKFRDVIKSVGSSDLASFMTEDNPARKAVDVLNDPGFLSNASDEQVEELEDMVVDSILSGIIFSDAALEESMPDSDVSSKNRRRMKVSPPENDKVMSRIKKMLEDLMKKFKIEE